MVDLEDAMTDEERAEDLLKSGVPLGNLDRKRTARQTLARFYSSPGTAF